MKLLLICLVFAYSEAVFLDSLFGGGCTTDADCHAGSCCIKGVVTNHCSDRHLHYLSQCHLSGHETQSCGCGPGLYCETYENIQGSIAVEHSPNLLYGLCEHGSASNMTTGAPGVAVEGRR